VKATGDEAIDATLSTLLPEIVKTYGETIVSEAVATIAGELVGAIFPRFNNVRLSYKQNRLERNVSIMLQQLVENDQMLSARISALEETENGRHFLKQSSEMLLDNIVDEIQPDKVKCNVSGYTNLLKTEDANIDMALMFFKTLAQLTEVDIRVLQNYDWRRSEMVELITPFNSVCYSLQTSPESRRDILFRPLQAVYTFSSETSVSTNNGCIHSVKTG